MVALTLLTSDATETLETKVNQALTDGNFLYSGLMVMPHDLINRDRFFQWISDEKIIVPQSHMTLIKADAESTMATRIETLLNDGKFLYGPTVIVPATSTHTDRFFQWVSDDDLNVTVVSSVDIHDVTGMSTAVQSIVYAADMDEIRALIGTGQDGREVQLTADDTDIKWRYVGDTDWVILVPLSELMGADGREVSLRVSGGFIQWQYTGDTDWTNLIATSLLVGADGPSVELQVAGGFIQWRVVGDPDWINLLSTASLKGADGPAIELRVDSGFIQWRVVGASTWINLIATSALTGAAGPAVEMQVSGGFIQWRVVGTTPWNNLIATSALTGAAGPAIELQVAGGFIQWRVVGASTWINLIATSTLTGGNGPANVLTIGTVTQGTAAATITGTTPAQVLNLVLPPGANGISYNPQTPVTRTITIGTDFQHTDLTKPYRTTVNIRATQSITVAGTAADKLELRVGPTAASVAPAGSGGFSVGVWESGITGIALMVGAGVQDGSSMFADIPAGWYFRVNRLSGTVATVVSCFTQSMTA